MLAAQRLVGADDHRAAAVADHGVHVGNLRRHVQVQQKLAAGEGAVHHIGGGKARQDPGVLLQ